MRLKNLLCVVAYRVPLKRADHAAVARFVALVTRMARGTDLALDPKDPARWAAQARAFSGSPVPEAVERAAWQRTKGGYGPRDVWDLCTALAAPREFESPKDRDAYAFALFAAASLLPPVVRALLDGREGKEVADALSDALRAAVPERTVDQGPSLLRAFAAFCARVENPLEADLRAYLECLRLSLAIPPEQVWAGVAAHFGAFSGGALSFSGGGEEGLVRAMAARPAALKEYMALCRREDHVQVAVNDSTTSVRLGFGSALAGASVRRVLRCCTGAGEKDVPGPRAPVAVIAAALREAEFAWEHGGL